MARVNDGCKYEPPKLVGGQIRHWLADTPYSLDALADQGWPGTPRHSGESTAGVTMNRLSGGSWASLAVRSTVFFGHPC